MVTYCYVNWKKKPKKSKKSKKNYKNICFCCMFLCVYLCFVFLCFVLSNPDDKLSLFCYDLENIDYMLRLCVICFGFNLHNLWLLEIPCSHNLCWFINCNPRSTLDMYCHAYQKLWGFEPIEYAHVCIFHVSLCSSCVNIA